MKSTKSHQEVFKVRTSTGKPGKMREEFKKFTRNRGKDRENWIKNNFIHTESRETVVFDIVLLKINFN